MVPDGFPGKNTVAEALRGATQRRQFDLDLAAAREDFSSRGFAYMTGRFIDIAGVRVGLSVCEDIWYPDGPPEMQARRGGAKLLINISASPYYMGKGASRERMLATLQSERARKYHLNMDRNGKTCISCHAGIAHPEYAEGLNTAMQ